MRKVFLAAALLCVCTVVHAAPFPTLSESVAVCDPNNPQHCAAPDGSGNVPITGTITASLGGFTPSASGARMRPLSVTTADSSGSLPTGAVVVVSNVGTTNPMYCIATGGTTTANGVGGAGLPTGAGGGGGGGGSSGAVFGPTAVGSAAANPPVLIAGTANAGATGNVQVAKVSASGLVSVDGSAVTQPVSGPTAVGSANANPPVIGGGTVTGAAGQNVVGVAVKPASTAPLATDTSLV